MIPIPVHFLPKVMVLKKEGASGRMDPTPQEEHCAQIMCGCVHVCEEPY